MDLVDSWRLVNMLINAILYGTLAATCCEMLRNIFEWSPSTATDQLEVIKRLSWEPICNDLSWYLSISRNMPLDVWPFNNYILQRQPIGPSVDCSTWWPRPSKAEVCGQSPGDACARDCHQGQGPWAAKAQGSQGSLGFNVLGSHDPYQILIHPYPHPFFATHIQTQRNNCQLLGWSLK